MPVGEVVARAGPWAPRRRAAPLRKSGSSPRTRCVPTTPACLRLRGPDRVHGQVFVEVEALVPKSRFVGLEGRAFFYTGAEGPTWREAEGTRMRSGGGSTRLWPYRWWREGDWHTTGGNSLLADEPRRAGRGIDALPSDDRSSGKPLGAQAFARSERFQPRAERLRAPCPPLPVVQATACISAPATHRWVPSTPGSRRS